MPGFIDTPLVESVPDKVMDMLIKTIPLGRIGKPSGMLIYSLLKIILLMFLHVMVGVYDRHYFQFFIVKNCYESFKKF